MQYLDIKKKFNNIKAVIFDMDGTLVNTTDLDILIFNEIFKKKINIKKYFGPSLKAIYKKLIKEKKIKGSLKMYIKLWHIIFRKYAEKKEFFDKKTIKTLKYLKQKYIIGIITSSDKYVTTLVLKNYKNLFDFVLTADDLKYSKPHPFGLNYIKNKYNLKDNEIVYIGDNINDIIFAKKAHVFSIGKVDLLYNETELKLYNPDYIIKKIYELKKIL